MIEFTCDCGNPVRAADDKGGKYVVCPACGERQLVPESEEEGITGERTTRAIDDYTEDQEPRRRRRPDDSDGPRNRPVAERPKSRTLLYTMIGLGAAALVGCVFCVPLLLLFPAVQKIRGAAARVQSENNLKQIGLAMHNYHDANGCLPVAYLPLNFQPGKPPQAGMSWRTTLLPYIEQGALYNLVQPQQPWDSPANQAIQSTVVRTYQLPGDPTASTQTYYQVFVTAPGKSPHSAFNHPTEQNPRVRWVDLKDGLAQTILVAESPTSVPWFQPQDMTFDPDQPPPPLGYHSGSESLILMGDAWVKRLPKNANPATVKGLITRDGGETVNLNW
jgi:DNA-directed RNA polymerase subunit RPC12/RpoP